MKRQKLTHLAALTVAVFVLAYLLSYMVPALSGLELKTIDWRFDWRGPISVEDSPVVIVAIDDNAFEVLPERWPWPRSYYARAIDNLERAGAAVIGIDVMLDVADTEHPDADLQLAHSLSQAENVVLAAKIEQSSKLSTYLYLVEPTPLLMENSSGQPGLVSIPIDDDGIQRRYPPAQAFKGSLYPSMGLEMLRRYRHYPSTVEGTFSHGKFILGESEIPLWDGSTMLINFAGPGGTFPTYSLSSVIDDESLDLGENDLNYFSENLLPDGVFKDKIVLIGSTVEELHDNFPTPYLKFEGAARRMPGVEIHANAINTILSGSYLTSIPLPLLLLLALALIILVEMICLRLSTLWSLLLTLALIIAYVLVEFALFSRFGWVNGIVFPTIAMFFAYVGTNLYQYILTQKEKKMIMGAFQQYVPAKVVQELLAHPEKLTLGGEERVLTVLFSDVANFTTISEALSPRQLVTLINDYLSAMTDIVLKYDGIIDKYEGDAIMAEFGAPVYYEDHALKACMAALEMQRRLYKMARKSRREGKPVLVCRVGINTGNMIVGNMGSDKVFDYTVLGDEVNLASRLEGANKAFGSRIMISEATYEIVKDQLITRPLDWIRVKGKNKPVRVFEVMALKEEKVSEALNNILPIYNNGITYYQNRNWEQAAECFRYCLRLRPEDGPSKVYLRRVMIYAKNPPPEDWDGVHEMKSK